MVLVNQTDKLISLLGRVVKDDYTISASDSDWRILEATLITATYICFWNVVTSGKDTSGDTGKVGFDRLRSDVDEHDLKSERAGIKHHLQIVLPR